METAVSSAATNKRTRRQSAGQCNEYAPILARLKIFDQDLCFACRRLVASEQLDPVPTGVFGRV